MKWTSANWMRTVPRRSLFIGLLFSMLGSGGLPAAHAQEAARNAGPTQAVVTLDGVDLSIQASSLPSGSFTAAEPGSASQVASSASWKPFREFAITAVPFGTKAGTESLPPAAPGSAESYKEALRSYRVGQGGAVSDGPVATLFGIQATAVRSLVWLNVDGPDLKPVVVDEWVVEAGQRLWLVRASQEQSSTDLGAQAEGAVADVSLSSSTLDRPSTLSDDLGGFGAVSPEQSVGAAALPTPSWWRGDCDTDTYAAGAGGLAAYRLGEVYLGMPACGPRPWSDDGPDVLVRFFSGAWGAYEWECVELSMRFLYLMYGINPYQGNGSQVVWNYSGSRLVKIPNDGTAGRAPRPNDVLSYGATATAGHTAVVTSSTVDANGNGTITVIEQNAAASGRSTLTVTNWTVLGNSSTISGWLHDASNEPTATPTVTSTATQTSTPTPGGTSAVTVTPTSDATWTPTGTADPSATATATPLPVLHSISGYAGAPGVKLSYADVVAKIATADAGGNYSFTVPDGWSGTVTPSLTGAQFLPANRSYSNVTADQTGQDYQAVLTRTFVSAGSQDGWLRESSETSGAGGTMKATGGSIRVGDEGGDQQYRSILSFDTSSLPDGAVVTSVTLRVKLSGTVGTNPYSTHGSLWVDIRKGSFSNYSALQIEDFQAPASAVSVGSLPNTPSGGWYSRTWTSGILSYIKTTGRTQLRLRFDRDDNDDLSADYLKFDSGDSTTTSYRPKLIVRYYVP